MASLASTLSATDLPVPELMAARLDGELFEFGDVYCPIDEIDSPRLRALRVHKSLSPRGIAERRTAAWVLGLEPELPTPLEVCADVGARMRVPHESGTLLREVVIEPGEWGTIAGLRLTTPLRTALDLARIDTGASTTRGPLLRALAAHGRFTLQDCREALARRRNLPHKQLALARLTAALSAELHRDEGNNPTSDTGAPPTARRLN